MKPERQRIAIAEACGWDRKSAERGFTVVVRREFDGFMYNQISEKCPHYIGDLNAMHEAENVLNTPVHMQKHAWNNYKAMLEMMTKGSAFHATASQRAEAFLKTLGLWEGGNQ